MKKLLLISVLIIAIKASSKESRVLQSPSFTATLSFGEGLGVRLGVGEVGSNVVYAARNLYNALTKKYTEFNPDCQPIAARIANKPKNNVGQRTTKNLEEDVKLFPNPASSFVTVFGKDIVNITIVSSQGKILNSQQTINPIQTRLDVSKFVAGLYFIKTVNKQGRTTVQKFFKE